MVYFGNRGGIKWGKWDKEHLMPFVSYSSSIQDLVVMLMASYLTTPLSAKPELCGGGLS